MLKIGSNQQCERDGERSKGGECMEKFAQEQYSPECPKFWLAGNKIGLEPAALARKPLSNTLP